MRPAGCYDCPRSEEHTSELQSLTNLVCRLLLESYRDHRHLYSFPTRRSSDLSLLLARHLKRQTFGLEPEEIATLLEQREASLHGIREGTIATDVDGKVTLINDEARRLLRLSEIGRAHV